MNRVIFGGCMPYSAKELLARFEQNAMEIGAYGDPDIDKIVGYLKQGDAESAADEVYGSYSDQDGGEVPRIEPMIQDLQDEFEELVQGGTELERTQQSEREGWRYADELEQERQRLQAVIDRLMLEHCPDEMTPEQIAEWERHQKAVPNVKLETRRQRSGERQERTEQAKRKNV